MISGHVHGYERTHPVFNYQQVWGKSVGISVDLVISGHVHSLLLFSYPRNHFHLSYNQVKVRIMQNKDQGIANKRWEQRRSGRCCEFPCDLG